MARRLPRTSVLILALWSGVSLVLSCSTVSQPPTPPSADSALVGGTIYASPTDAPIGDGVILVRDGKIVAVGSRGSVPIPPDAAVLECSGMTIVAGFWNSHVHFFERKWIDAATIPMPELTRQLQDMLTRYGFTSVFDTGSMWANTRQIRDRIESGEVSGPRIRSTGEALVARGAVPPARILGVLGIMAFPFPEIADAAQATLAAQQLLEQGVDGIKVHLQPPPPPDPPLAESAMRAAIEAAHRAGKPAFVHPDSGADVLAAIRCGADIVAHTTPRSGPWDAAIVGALAERRVALTPTLTLWRSFLRHDRGSLQEQLTNTAVGQLRAWNAAGGTVLFGTDLGAVDYDPSQEYALMAAAGMSFRQILASLTTAPAEQFGDSARLGRIAPGLEADLVVLRGDPAKDPRAFADVRYTLRAGHVVHP